MICNAMRHLREVSRSHVAKPKELPGNAFSSIKGLLSGMMFYSCFNFLQYDCPLGYVCAVNQREKRKENV